MGHIPKETDKIQIYTLDIRGLGPVSEAGLSLVTPRRRDRVRAFLAEADRRRCLGAGLLLRAVLGVREDRQLVYGDHGKPALENGPCFSLSHGGDYVLLAVSGGAVGVDVERVGPFRARVAAYACTPAEHSWLCAGDRPQRLYTLWTRKESVMKAAGLGLFLRPSDFTVLPLDAPCRAAGGTWFLTGAAFSGHIVSAAADRETDGVALIPLSPAELFKH